MFSLPLGSDLDMENVNQKSGHSFVVLSAGSFCWVWGFLGGLFISLPFFVVSNI